MSGQLAAVQGRPEVAERQLELARAIGATDYSLEFLGHEAYAAGLIALERGRGLEARGHCAEVMALAARAADESTGAMLLSLGVRVEADIAERSRARRRAGEEDAARAGGRREGAPRAAAGVLAAAWRELSSQLDPRHASSPEVDPHVRLAEAEHT